MKKKNGTWLHDNIAYIIALIVVLFSCYLDRLILLKAVQATDNITFAIITNIHGLAFLVIGYWFAKSKQEPSVGAQNSVPEPSNQSPIEQNPK